MLASQQWAENFSVESSDIEYLTTILLETEIPQTTQQLAETLVQNRLNLQKEQSQERFAGASMYDPSQAYAVSDRIIMSEYEYALAEVVRVRDGFNPSIGEFQVIAVQFDDAEKNNANSLREFAANFSEEHALKGIGESDLSFDGDDTLTTEAILESSGNVITNTLENALENDDHLIKVAKQWFPKDLVTELDVGHLHLAEAVIDMAGGVPVSPQQILEGMGGIEGSAPELQLFSLNLALNNDPRFDEVGPEGEVLWFLSRLEPEWVKECPPVLRYQAEPYDESIIPEALQLLEQEIADEFSDISPETEQTSGAFTLIYPHRVVGSLPINAVTKLVLPTAQTPHILIEIVDALDGDTYSGWVVHEHRYVYGIKEYYEKHKLAVGTYINLEPGEHAGQVIIRHDQYRPRTEWINVVVPHPEHILMDTKKRAIGAAFDDLMIIGVDDLAAVTNLADEIRNKNKSLTSTIKAIIQTLRRLSPQGAIHAKTIYSAVNVFRRCPPGPIFAILSENPDFESVDDFYWGFSE